MVSEDFFAQGGAVDVDVNLGGLDALVAQHLLDGAQVGATLEQVGGETVAQGVRADDLAHACQFAQLLDDVENHLPCQHRPSTVQEQDILAAALGDLAGTRLFQVQVNLLDGDRRDGDDALLVALADDIDKTLVQVDVRDEEPGALADAEAAAVQDFQDGAVPQAN